VATERLPKPPSLVLEELRRAYREIRGAELSPGRGAAAVALGLFIGSIPIYGAHTPLVLGLCLWLRLDGFIAWVAANISNPLFSLVLVPVEVQVGAWLINGELFPMNDLQAAVDTGFSGFFLYALAGSPLVAATLAVVGAALTFVGIRFKRRFRPAATRPAYSLPEHAPAWWHAVERVAARYAPLQDASSPTERSRFHYVRMKLMGDPVMRRIAELDVASPTPTVLGEVLDVGTGRGQLPIVLLELGRAGSVTGFDWDGDKIEAAQAAVAREPALDARFLQADMTADDTAYPDADTVLLVDVIHYLPLAEQDRVLERAAAAVRPSGRLLLREADTERGWRSWVTLLEERVFTALRFNRGAQVTFRPARTIVERLEAAGLSCRVEPAWGKTPFSNVLIVGERPAGG
jgi:SAM-dependent methyltransferase/uncharacterized protein (DUF2062 family)